MSVAAVTTLRGLECSPVAASLLLFSGGFESLPVYLVWTSIFLHQLDLPAECCHSEGAFLGWLPSGVPLSFDWTSVTLYETSLSSAYGLAPGLVC